MIKTEAVFTKTEMRNERNVNSLQVLSNDIQDGFEHYQDWSCIYQDINKKLKKRSFGSNLIII